MGAILRTACDVRIHLRKSTLPALPSSSVAWCYALANWRYLIFPDIPFVAGTVSVPCGGQKSPKVLERICGVFVGRATQDVEPMRCRILIGTCLLQVATDSVAFAVSFSSTVSRKFARHVKKRGFLLCFVPCGSKRRSICGSHAIGNKVRLRITGG